MALGADFGNQGRGRRRRSMQPLSEINVTPFVDVMLVLLIIFMVTAPMMTAGVNVDLPKSAAKAIKGNDEPLSIAVNNQGEIYIQKTQVQLNELAAKLTAVAGENKDIRIFIRGDKQVDYGKVMAAVGEINAAGFTKVSLITEQSGQR